MLRFRIALVIGLYLLVPTRYAHAGSSTPPYLALGFDPYLTSSLRSGFAVELLNYPWSNYGIAFGANSGTTLLHRETFHNAVFLFNHLRGAPTNGLNFKLEGGLRYFNHQQSSTDLTLSYALPVMFSLTSRLGVQKRIAASDARQQEFMYKEVNRPKDVLEVILSLELITGRLDR